MEKYRAGTREEEIQDARVEKCRCWMRHKLGTGDPTAMNSSPMVNQRKADLELGTASFRGNKENKEIFSPTLKKYCT